MASRPWITRLVVLAALPVVAGWLPPQASGAQVRGGAGRPAAVAGASRVSQVARRAAARAARRAAVARAAAAAAAAAAVAVSAPAVRVTDSGGRRRSKAGLPAPVMSQAMLRADAEKQALTRSLRQRMRPLARRGKCTRWACRRRLPAVRVLRGTQQAQTRDYYCGPATVSEMLAQMGKRVSQWRAGRELRTSAGGTDWSNGAGYPVPRVLNRNQKLNDYVAVALPWAPTRQQIRTYDIDLVADLNHNGGVPLAGDAYEVPDGPHLVGHPANQTIYHWIDIRGYQNAGATTDYEDSVHGASSIGWSDSVPAYSSLSSAVMVEILGARGYDW